MGNKRMLVWGSKGLSHALTLQMSGADEYTKKKILGENYKEYTIEDIHRGNG